MITPPTTKEQKKKWEDIPTNVFWIKISLIIFLASAIGLLLMAIINI